MNPNEHATDVPCPECGRPIRWMTGGETGTVRPETCPVCLVYPSDDHS